MTKTPSISIDFDTLNNIPYIKQFDQDKFKEMVHYWLEDWAQYQEHFPLVAFIRALECTNGCTQYAYRDQDPDALPEEQTRICMRISMGFFKTKSLILPNGDTVSIPADLAPQIDKVREVYINAFKKQDRDALLSFYAQSVAIFNLLGERLIDDAQFTVAEHYRDLFTEHFIVLGGAYMKQFLQVLPEEIRDPENVV